MLVFLQKNNIPITKQLCSPFDLSLNLGDYPYLKPDKKNVSYSFQHQSIYLRLNVSIHIYKQRKLQIPREADTSNISK